MSDKYQIKWTCRHYGQTAGPMSEGYGDSVAPKSRNMHVYGGLVQPLFALLQAGRHTDVVTGPRAISTVPSGSPESPSEMT